jgi:hypothetical protein
VRLLQEPVQVLPLELQVQVPEQVQVLPLELQVQVLPSELLRYRVLLLLLRMLYRLR